MDKIRSAARGLTVQRRPPHPILPTGSRTEPGPCRLERFQRRKTNTSLIPKGTLAKVRLTIRPGGFDDRRAGPVVMPRAARPVLSIQWRIHRLEGPYARRKIFTLIGLYSPKARLANMGRAFVRGMLNSAVAFPTKTRARRTGRAPHQLCRSRWHGLSLASTLLDANGDDKNEVCRRDARPQGLCRNHGRGRHGGTGAPQASLAGLNPAAGRAVMGTIERGPAMLPSSPETLVERSLSALDTHANTLGVAPTGAGKTIMLSAVTGSMIGDTDAKAVFRPSRRTDRTEPAEVRPRQSCHYHLGGRCQSQILEWPGHLRHGADLVAQHQPFRHAHARSAGHR